MLGKSGGLALGLAILFTVSSCARNVVQDSKSGEDSKEKGAKPMTLDNGEAKAHGIVTYPGGDRVDWKMVELPSRGTMDIKLQWQPPRPGLQLSFDVFDEWNAPIVQSMDCSLHVGATFNVPANRAGADTASTRTRPAPSSASTLAAVTAATSALPATTSATASSAVSNT